MVSPHRSVWVCCAILVPLLCASASRAELPKLPETAIADDTFFVGTLDFVGVSPANLEASAKAAIGDTAGPMDELIATYKKHYEKFADKGAESVTVILRGDPDKQKEPEPVFYVKFKAGTDQAAAETALREGEDAANPVWEISHDGDLMIVRLKGLELPAAGSPERTQLFSEAAGQSDKPVRAALIFNDAMRAQLGKAAGQGAPPAVTALASDAKWFRVELSLGDAPKADVTIRAADDEAAKRVADSVAQLGDMLKTQAAQIRQMGAQAPQLASIADGMMAMSSAFKPTQAGTSVTFTADAKAVGGMVTGWLTTRAVQAGNAPGKKGGL